MATVQKVVLAANLACRLVSHLVVFLPPQMLSSFTTIDSQNQAYIGKGGRPGPCRARVGNCTLMGFPLARGIGSSDRTEFAADLRKSGSGQGESGMPHNQPVVSLQPVGSHGQKGVTFLRILPCRCAELPS